MMSRLLAPFLVVHGAIHIGYICGPAWPFVAADAWPVTLFGVDPGALRAMGIALALSAFLGYLLAAVSAGFAPSIWPLVLPVAAAASAIVLILFVTPWTLPGLAIDAVLLFATFGRAWRPTPYAAGHRRLSSAGQAPAR
jgi:hypothetical protein